MQDDFQDAESRVEKARELFDRGKWEAAAKELRAAIRVNPHNFHWHFDLGVTLDQLGQYDQAVVAFRSALALEADDIESLNALGIDLTRTGAPQAAIECFERCQKLDPDYEPSYCNRIMAYTDLGDHQKAEEMFYLARQLSDECPYCSFNLGESLYRRGLYDKAIAAWRQVLRGDPQHGDVHYRIGCAHWALGKLRSARRHFRAQLRHDPGHLDALIDLGRLLLEADQAEAAREKFNRVLELEATNAYVWGLLGEAELRLERPDRARSAFERALKLDADQTWVRLGLAELAIDDGNLPEAVRLITEELALKHEQLDVLEDAGRLAMEADRPDLAEQAFAAALAIEPQNVEAGYGLAVALAAQGRTAACIQRCQQTLQRDPKHVPTLHRLATSLAQAGQLADAADTLAAALKLAPEDAALLKLARRVRLLRAPFPVGAAARLLARFRRRGRN